MNWYRKAKLIDKSMNSTRQSPKSPKIHAVCQYCKKWATNPNEFNDNPSEYVWKLEKDFDNEEMIQMQEAIKGMETEEVVPSHGICPICMDILKKNNYSMDINEVTRISLLT